MTAASNANIDLTVLDNSVFAIINKLMKQQKPENLCNIQMK